MVAPLERSRARLRGRAGGCYDRGTTRRTQQLTNRTRPDRDRMSAAVIEMLSAIGDDPTREGLRETPRRISDMYLEIFEGLGSDPREHLRVGFEVAHDEMVILRNIPFYSMCEHHFLPFHGEAHVGYIPDGRVVGVSKLARVVEGYARRPQIQEQLTSQIAEAIMEVLKPDGVGVVIEAEHLCMTMRGVRKPGARMITSAMRGDFRASHVTRAEFLSLLQGKG
ncbi:MAG: GTP cyclohydrolase I FolE [Dehalococcoidia bacterium]|nr:MAG: GTP cyclohydrolase I FolE [Dehalococcoidia bacterium]